MIDSAVTNCLQCGLRYSHCRCMDVIKTIPVPVYLLCKRQPENKQVVQTAAGEMEWNAARQRFVTVDIGASVIGNLLWWSPRVMDLIKENQ